MKYLILICSFFSCLMLSPIEGFANATRLGELWQGSAYTSTFRVGVCTDESGNVEGVMIIKLRSGAENVYHFSGNLDEHGIYRLKHNSSNHRFEGRLENDYTVVGTGISKNGFSVDLEALRFQNVVLTNTCRPLPN